MNDSTACWVRVRLLGLLSHGRASADAAADALAHIPVEVCRLSTIPSSSDCSSLWNFLMTLNFFINH